MRKDLEVDTYNYILAAVNDCEDEGEEGGGHWSLLVSERAINTYYDLDSLEPLNQ